MLTFENALAANFNVSPQGASIFHEQQDAPGSAWDAPGPIAPHPSNRILQTDQPAHVHVSYRVYGSLAPVICGEWKVKICFSRICGGNAAIQDFTTTVASVDSTDHTYNVSVQIPANTLPSGLYRMSVIVMLCDKKGNPLPVIGYEEIGPLLVYQG